MLKCAILFHSQAAHDCLGSSICHRRERHDLLQANHFKTDAQDFPRRLGRKAITPVLIGKSPSDFNAWGERQLISGYVQTDEAQETPRRFQLNSPETPPALGNKAGTAVGHGIALLSAQQVGKIRHDAWVGIEFRKWRFVALAPLSQYESISFRFENLHGCCLP
tara:strand:- start:3362 stop:3853 length:492 start_codon:yes stop_codon:yes gene_type:complete